MRGWTTGAPAVIPLDAARASRRDPRCARLAGKRHARQSRLQARLLHEKGLIQARGHSSGCGAHGQLGMQSGLRRPLEIVEKKAGLQGAGVQDKVGGRCLIPV